MNQENEKSTTPEMEEEQQARTFTQDEVDKIVRERLARDRKGRPNPAASESLEEREKKIAARESLMDCKEYLAKEKLTSDLLDLFDSSDFGTFKESVSKLINMLPKLLNRKQGAWGAPLENGISDPKEARFAEVFKRKD